MSIANRHIVDIYHAHAQSNSPDDLARRHVHGLSRSFLEAYGFSSEEALVLDFKMWLRGKNVIAMYANAPAKEIKLLNNPNILDMRLPNWSDRYRLVSHKTAREFKKKAIPITSSKLSVRCSLEAHSDFKFIPTPRRTMSELAKKDYGYHCSLYDTYALYLHYVTDN
ncbi:MAG: hypothetical protein AAGK05_00075 [Pseudomonadota bacterium]